MKDGNMEPFFCPQCGRKSEYEPMAGPAICPECGHTPPTDVRVLGESRAKPEPLRRKWRSKQPDMHLSLLNELLSHWDGTHVSMSPVHQWWSAGTVAIVYHYEGRI